MSEWKERGTKVLNSAKFHPLQSPTESTFLQLSILQMWNNAVTV